ncbi:MAG: ACT domain-containing protein [Eubacteriales bacterium]|nr:ACT domain-containing protein [Eubacteriales bacterium]
MEKQPKFYIVDSSLLPEVFLKAARVNCSLQSGEFRTVGEATQKVGLSRSAYYKYKDGIKPLFEAANHSIITFNLMVTDEAGVLSEILTVFARSGANILTINQSIPVNGQAAVTIAARTGEMNCSVEQMMADILAISGVARMEILARE